MANKRTLINIGIAAALILSISFLLLTMLGRSKIEPTSNPLTFTSTTYGFQISLPKDSQILPLKEEGLRLGDSIIAGGIKIYLPSSLGKESNPKATSIADYTHDYASPYLAIKIHFQSTSTINSWKVLKQEYSSGKITSNEFVPDEEFGSSHAIRYIFDNGRGDLIILPVTNKSNEDYLDKVAASFRFIQK
jgi:hypothetical protein